MAVPAVRLNKGATDELARRDAEITRFKKEVRRWAPAFRTDNLRLKIRALYAEASLLAAQSNKMRYAAGLMGDFANQQRADERGKLGHALRGFFMNALDAIRIDESDELDAEEVVAAEDRMLENIPPLSVAPVAHRDVAGIAAMVVALAAQFFSASFSVAVIGTVFCYTAVHICQTNELLPYNNSLTSV